MFRFSCPLLPALLMLLVVATLVTLNAVAAVAIVSSEESFDSPFQPPVHDEIQSSVNVNIYPEDGNDNVVVTKDDGSSSRGLQMSLRLRDIIDALGDPTCISNEKQLRIAISRANTNRAKPRTLIKLCRANIDINPTLDPVRKVTGIDLTNKLIDFRCYAKPVPSSCALNGLGKSRIFFGSAVNLTFQGVNFVNAMAGFGDHLGYGSAITFFNKSSVTLNGCSFLNNTAYNEGGAIFMETSTLVVKGGTLLKPVRFAENKAIQTNAGAISLSKSRLFMNKGVTQFYNNVAKNYIGALGLYGSSAMLKGVSFIENVAQTYDVGAIGVSESTLIAEDVLFTKNKVSAFTSTLEIRNSSATLINSNFIENGNASVVTRFSSSRIHLKNCTFSKNFASYAPIDSKKSNVTLEQVRFSNNTDDGCPAIVGDYFTCTPNNTFCEGLGNTSCLSNLFSNCSLVGLPGVGVCPL